MATVKENLIAAKALIDTPEKWCPNGPASYNNGVMARCVYIAVGEVCEHSVGGVFAALYRALPWWFRLSAPRWDQRAIIRFNDRKRTTHADIMALFDRAIAAQDSAP